MQRPQQLRGGRVVAGRGRSGARLHLGKQIVGHGFAQFNSPLVKTRDAPQHTLHKDAMLVQGNELSQGFGVQLVEQPKRAWTVAFKRTVGLPFGRLAPDQQGFGLENVLQLPYQPRARLPESLAACDLSAIGLIPGAEDTVAPCKFYGILASGRAVVLIARRSCDLAQLVLKEGCGIVVEPGEAAELAQQLQTLSQQPEQVAAMGQRSLELYEQRFGMERSIDRYAALLEHVA